MYKTLNSKLVLIFIVFIIAVMATVGIFLMNSVNDFYTDEFVAQMEDGFSDNILDQLTDALEYDDFAQSQNQLLSAYANVFGFDSGRGYYILDKDANVIISSDPDAKSVEITPNIMSAMNGTKSNSKQSFGADFLDYAHYIQKGDNSCIIYVKDDLSEMRSLSFMQFSIIIQALIVGLIIAFIMSFFLAKAITGPIKSIASGTIKVADGDYSYRIASRSRDEIGTLSKNFNNMAQVIENTLEAVSGEREKLKNVFNRLDAGVAAFEEDGTLMHINPSALSMLSLPESNTPTFNELTAALGTPDVSMQTLKSVGHVHVEEKTLSDIATRELVVTIDFGVFGYDSSAKSGYIVVFQNITESALLEKNRREFIANVSHELRTPLTSVKGATETILEDDEMPESIRRHFLNIVINESDRMTRIVQDLLVLSRLDNRRMSWKPVKFDMYDSINQMCSALRAEAQTHSHRLIFDTQKETAYPIYADKERIEQVITNIIGNAIKYTPDGGKITVALWEDANQKYNISVQDTGVGISKEDISHLFERFYRVDKSRSTDAGGTGLGLSIAKDIIDAHGGKIDVESTVGEGTTVTVILPKDTRIGEDVQ